SDHSASGSASSSEYAVRMLARCTLIEVMAGASAILGICERESTEPSDLIRKMGSSPLLTSSGVTSIVLRETSIVDPNWHSNRQLPGGIRLRGAALKWIPSIFSSLLPVRRNKATPRGS